MKTVAALTGMLTRPVQTLRALAQDGANALAPVAMLVVAVALVDAKQLQRLALLLGDGGTVILRRIRDLFFDDLKTHAALIVGTAVVVAVLAQLLAKGRIAPARAAAASTYLVVPLVIFICVGGFLDAVGVSLWWLPHLPVDSMAVVVGRQVSWVRFAVKCAVSYGPPLVLALAWVRTFVKDGPLPAAAPASRVGGAVLGVAFLLLVGGAVSSSVRYADRIRPVLPGEPLPDIKLHRLDEYGISKDTAKLSSFEGKVLILDFWASWCAPCRRAMPELSKLYDAHKAEGLVVLGVNREPQDPNAARKALKEIAPSFDCVVDDRGYGDRLGLTTLPTSYIVDKHGKVRHLHLGYTELDIVEAEVKALLAE